jgi:hypothetical protein
MLLRGFLLIIYVGWVLVVVWLLMVVNICRLVLVVHVETHIDDLLKLDHNGEERETETGDRENEVNEVVLVESVHKSPAPIVGIESHVLKINFYVVDGVDGLPDSEEDVAGCEEETDHMFKHAAQFAQTRVLLCVLHICTR